MENNKQNPEPLIIRPSATPGQPVVRSEDDFPPEQPPITPMERFLYLQKLRYTKSTIFGVTENGTIMSEYFHIPKGAKRNNNIDHKTAVTNALCLGDRSRIENMQILYALQVINREESMIIWDNADQYRAVLEPILEENNYRILSVSLPSDAQGQLCESIAQSAIPIERLEQVIDVSGINEMLQMMRGKEDKTTIFISVETPAHSPRMERLYTLFAMHIIMYISSVGRTEIGRYFYWPTHFIIPEIALFNEEQFPYRFLELARYRGFLAFLGSERCPSSLTCLQFRPVIKTSFVNNLVVLDSKIMDELQTVIERDLSIDMKATEPEPGKDPIVRILTEQQIRNKMAPFYGVELPYTQHPLLTK